MSTQRIVLYLAVAATGISVAVPVVATVAVTALLSIAWVQYVEMRAEIDHLRIEHDTSAYVARVAALEDSLEKLKGTAAALLKVEARTSAVERSLAHQMREDI